MSAPSASASSHPLLAWRLAKTLQTTGATISRIENCHTFPRLALLERIVDVTGAQPEAFLRYYRDTRQRADAAA